MWLWSEGGFSLLRQVLWKSSKETWSSFSLSWISDCNSISYTWKLVSYVFTLSKSWHLFSYSCSKRESTAAQFSLFTGLCLVNISKWVRLFAITWDCYNLSFISTTVITWNIAQRWIFHLKDVCLTHSNEWLNSSKVLNLWTIFVVFKFWHEFSFWFH